MSRTVKTVAITVAAAVLLSACGDGGTIFKKSHLGDIEVLSIDARQRLVLRGVDSSTGRPVVCAEPSPDAIVAQAAILAASGSGSGSLPAGGGTAAGGRGGLATGYSEGVGSIAMRTPMIQMMRDGYYRYCEALLNGVMTKEDYRRVLKFVDVFLVTVMAIEALGGTVVVPPVTVNAGFTANVDKEGGLTTSGTAGPAQALTFTITNQPMDPATAEAIAEVVKSYHKHKKEMALYWERQERRCGRECE